MPCCYADQIMSLPYPFWLAMHKLADIFHSIHLCKITKCFFLCFFFQNELAHGILQMPKDVSSEHCNKRIYPEAKKKIFVFLSICLIQLIKPG